MSESKPTKKREYEKPSAKAISLEADEVLTLGCKTEGGGVSAGNPPTPPGCALSGCNAEGS